VLSVRSNYLIKEKFARRGSKSIPTFQFLYSWSARRSYWLEESPLFVSTTRKLKLFLNGQTTIALGSIEEIQRQMHGKILLWGTGSRLFMIFSDKYLEWWFIGNKSVRRKPTEFIMVCSNKNIFQIAPLEINITKKCFTSFK
jgi:hypothetical protein